MAITLGREPEDAGVLILTHDADWTQIIDAPAGEAFPAGTRVFIRLYARSAPTGTPLDEWEADVFPSHAEWRVESEVANPIPNQARFRVYVSYPDAPTLEHCWIVGSVLRKQ